MPGFLEKSLSAYSSLYPPSKITGLINEIFLLRLVNRISRAAKQQLTTPEKKPMSNTNRRTEILLIIAIPP